MSFSDVASITYSGSRKKAANSSSAHQTQQAREAMLSGHRFVLSSLYR